MIGDVLEALFIRGQVVSIGGLEPSITIDQDLLDSVTLTDHPVEYGASITDHAYVNPSEVSLRFAFSEASVVSQVISAVLGSSSSPGPDEAYQQLRDMMTSRVPIDVMTTRRVYTNMVIVSLTVHTDAATNYILDATARLRQVIIVSTQVTSVKPDTQASPQATLPIVSTGTLQPKPVPQSFLSSIAGVFVP